MENCSLHSQILSVMEVLAKAAVAEIHRRVDDSCAVLRLEVSQSRRDIELLRRKYEMMEAELRRTRMRARRKGFYPPAAERFTPSVRIVLNKERRSTDWDALQIDAETPNSPEQIDQAELVKEEHSEEHMWRNNQDETAISEVSHPAQSDSFTEHQQSEQNPVLPESASSPADAYDTFPEQQVDESQNEVEFIVKLENDEEPDENAAPHDLAQTFKAGEGDGQLWSSSLCSADPNSSYTGQQFEISPSMFPSQSGLVPDMASTTQAVRCARTFGYKRPQLDEGQSTFPQVNNHCLLPQQPQHARRDPAPHPGDGSTQSNAALASSCGRSSFSLVRRMRTPWRSGIGEKRFSCTYCEKSFMRFSQLKEHLRSHTGEKPFSCLQCGRSFTKQCNLIRHAVVHSGEKPYKCSQCGKCFTQRSSLKSHQKTAH